ncbi:PREDICTED: serine-arginine protein 55-like isoform X4 [Polistes dominula]|uniref:Serine-arginine protein 55-like isoform X4 n=1 Tax=Polistes dominula TaxID=743375 RepID=A0ABM1J1W7_POLDO|nr:PREDICTED: serine-arginine protein 55-like isoform X4 [Polistes dominula]
MVTGLAEMDKSNENLDSHNEKRRGVFRSVVQPSQSRNAEEKQRRREEWKKQMKLQQEHEKLKKRKILEYELNRYREIKARSSRGRSASESDRKTRDRSSRDKSLDKKIKATSSKSSNMADKSGFSSRDDSTTRFRGPEGVKISKEELRTITVNIHRKLSVENPSFEINRDILVPEEIVIRRRSGEGSKPIFEREELKSNTKEHTTEIFEERRTVKAAKSSDTGRKSESLRRRSSPSSNVSRHRSHRSSSSQRSKRHSRERSRERGRRRYIEHDDRPSGSSNRYESSSRNVERDSYRDYKKYLRDHCSNQNYSHRSESRRGSDKEEERDRSSSSKLRTSHYSDRERRSRSRSRSRDSRYRERRQVAQPPYDINQIPYPVYYGPRPMMVGPMMPIRGQVPIPRGRLPPSGIGPIRPFPPRFMPPNAYRFGPPSNYWFGPMP